MTETKDEYWISRHRRELKLKNIFYSNNQQTFLNIGVGHEHQA